MQLLMDQAALAAFLAREFGQVSDDLRIDAVAPGQIEVSLVPQLRHLRPGGTVSGPAMFALADVGAYLLVLAHIGPKALAVTTSCHLDFMRKPAADAPLVWSGRLLKLGKRLAVVDGVIDQSGAGGAVARASLTYALPD